jgi:hypothetical protein
MYLLDNNKVGLFFYGTADTGGKQILFKDNISLSIDDLNLKSQDLRGVVPLNLSDYYIINFFDKNPLYSVISLVHYIVDKENRPGYFTTSIVIYNNNKLQSNEIILLLSDLYSKFKTNFFEYNYKDELIKKDIKIEENFFKDILGRFNQKLITPKNRLSTNDNLGSISLKNLFLSYSTSNELESIINQYNRIDFLQYDKIFIMPESNVSLLPKDDRFKISTLPPLKKDIKLYVAVRNIQNQNLNGVNITVVGNNGYKHQQTLPFSNALDINGENTIFTITATKQDFDDEEKTIIINSDDELLNSNNDYIEKKEIIYLQPKLKPQPEFTKRTDNFVNNPPSKSTESYYEEKNKENQERPVIISESKKEKKGIEPKTAKKLYAILGVIGVLVIGFFVYYEFLKDNKLPTPLPTPPPTVLNMDSINDLKLKTELITLIKSIDDSLKNYQNTKENLDIALSQLSVFKDSLNKIKNSDIKTEVLNLYNTKEKVLANKSKNFKLVDEEAELPSDEDKQPVKQPIKSTNNATNSLEDLKQFIINTKGEKQVDAKKIETLFATQKQKNINSLNEFHKWLSDNRSKYFYSKELLNKLGAIGIN